MEHGFFRGSFGIAPGLVQFFQVKKLEYPQFFGFTLVKHLRQEVICFGNVALGGQAFGLVVLGPGNQNTRAAVPGKILVAIAAALISVFGITVLYHQLIGVAALQKGIIEAFYFLLGFLDDWGDLFEKIKIFLFEPPGVRAGKMGKLGAHGQSQVSQGFGPAGLEELLDKGVVLEPNGELALIQDVEESLGADFVQNLQHVGFLYLRPQVGSPLLAVAPIIELLGIRRVLKLKIGVVVKSPQCCIVDQQGVEPGNAVLLVVEISAAAVGADGWHQEEEEKNGCETYYHGYGFFTWF